MKVFVILACMVAIVTSWQNSYDKPVNFHCPGGQSISSIISVHNNGKEDRIWQHSCKTTTLTSSCRWYHTVNNWDDILLFQCPNNGAIVATSSYHNNHSEDRRFSYKCCNVPDKCNRNCIYSSWVNGWDSRMNYHVPSGRYLRGAFSVHSNHREDRRWRFETCTV